MIAKTQARTDLPEMVNRRESLELMKGILASSIMLATPLSVLALPVVLPSATGTASVKSSFAYDSQASLDAKQSDLFRAWFSQIVLDQLKTGPNPRWVHRDCAGLVRFAVDETLRDHDHKWKKSNGFLNVQLPAELELTETQKKSRQNWRLADGTNAAYVNALELIQENTRFIGQSVALASPADLLFFDMADQQHVMIWMGRYIAYHTGQISAKDNGLRAISLKSLAQWKDTRWRPLASNPNFRGVYRLGFLV